MSFNLDIKTIILLLILGNFFSGILILAYNIDHKNDRAINLFLFSKLFEFIAWILIGLRNYIPDFFSILLGNLFLFMGSVMFITAIFIIKNIYTPAVKRAYLIIYAACVSIFGYTALFQNSESARILVASILGIVIWCFPIYALFTGKKSTVLQRVIAVTFGLALVSFVLRIYEVIVLGDALKLLSSDVFNAWSFISLYIDMLVGGTSFVLLAKEKTDLDLKKAATIDELTDIYNRREFISQAKKSIALFWRRKEPVAFLLIDIDYFKNVNDMHGHYSGDELLVFFAQKIQGQLRKYDLFGRFGGDEFAILLPGTNKNDARMVAERIRKTIEAARTGSKNDIRTTISVGIASFVPADDDCFDLYYKLSDDALYQAKARGRNRVEVVTGEA